MQYSSLLSIPQNFFLQDTHTIAKSLLQYVLLIKRKNCLIGGRVVEAEVYTADDPSSHSFNGRTPRNKAMFEKSGTIYVYISYGMHLCLNIVAGKAGVGDAVLIRALEPILGLEVMKENRGIQDIRKLCYGPGCLTQALGIDLAFNNGLCTSLNPALSIEELQEECIYIGKCNKDYLSSNRYDIMIGPRIGISKSTDWNCRYFLKNNKYVSSHKKGKDLYSFAEDAF